MYNYTAAQFLKVIIQAPLYPHRTLWRYTNAVLLLLVIHVRQTSVSDSVNMVLHYCAVCEPLNEAQWHRTMTYMYSDVYDTSKL